MAIYEIDPAKLGAKTAKKLADIAMELVFDPVGERLLSRVQEKLPRSEGIREVPDADYQAALEAGRTLPVTAARPLSGASRLEASARWKLAPKSPRQATLHWLAAGGDEQALGIELGDGRGDRIEIMRPVLPGLRITGVSLDVQPTVTLS